MAYLIALNTALLRRQYRLLPGVTRIGRDAACEIVAAGRRIARIHAELRLDRDGGCTLHDMTAGGNLYVNRRSVSDCRTLEEGDVIGLGAEQAVHLRFQRAPLESTHNPVVLPWKVSWTLGRSPHADLPMPFETTASTPHATLRVRDGGVLLTDLGSLYGSWVNGARQRRAMLSPTDVLTAGPIQFRLSAGPGDSLVVSRRECADGFPVACRGLHAPGVLEDIRFEARPGMFVGVFGPSRAGKTALLRTLCGFQPPAYGEVHIHEEPLYARPDMFRGALGYVPRELSVHESLPVVDVLLYAARLRLPADMTAEQRLDAADVTLESLGLGHVRRRRVADLSAEDRKRVSIAVELLTRPAALFLNDPTAGLDDGAEAKLLRDLRRIAHGGVTTFVAARVLYDLGQFDRVVFLSHGKLAFFGTPDEAVEFFADPGGPPLPATDILDRLEHVAVPDGAPLTGAAASAHHAARFRAARGGTAECEAPAVSARPRRRIRFGAVSPRVWWNVARREFAVQFSSPERALFFVALPVAFALAMFALPGGEVRGGVMTVMPSSMIALLGLTMSAPMIGAIMACRMLSTERTIYFRERRAFLGRSEYLGGKLAFLLPVTALQVAALLLLCQMHATLGGIGLLPAYATLVAAAWTAVALGLVLSALDPSPGNYSIALAAWAILPQMFLSGGITAGRLDEAPLVFRAGAALFPGRWCFEALLTALYFRPDNPAFARVHEFIGGTLGFEFGPSVYPRTALILLAQAACWLALCLWLLGRQDRRLR